MSESPAKPMPTWFKWANIIIGIIALILGIGIVFFPFVLIETFVLYLGVLLIFTGVLKAIHSFQQTAYPNWLRYTTVIFGILILVLGVPIIFFASSETTIVALVLLTLILVGVFIMMINIQSGAQPGSRRTVFLIIGVMVIILIIAFWVANFLVLLAYIFFIMIGFFLIALDALATGIFRK
ncbi:MAG: DUF308 domain-containing protein [Candidatus Thorarchaeota archaeon]